VTWSVNGTAGGNSTVGTISVSGLYTAPTTVPNSTPITVKATSHAGTTKSGTASVSLSYPAPAIPTITPDSVSVGSADTKLAVFGTGLTPVSVVNFDGQPLPTRFVGNTQVTSSIKAAILCGGAAVFEVILCVRHRTTAHAGASAMNLP
jgi:hypothetical protein